MNNTEIKTNKNYNRIVDIVDSLIINPNPEAIDVLEEIGTNSSIDEVRELTAKALVKRNETKSLSIVISQKGKGINDMSTVVAMSTINCLLSLEDKQEAMKILEETIASEDLAEDVIENARSVRALMNLSF
ncbi:hypothetical protein J6G99_06115 [bacterium]|nr:hypothetical protein [bacterium]